MSVSDSTDLHDANAPAGEVRFPSDRPVARLLVKASRSYVVVRTYEIHWAESAANYVVLHTSRGKHVLRCTLAELDRRLADGSFFRASRSALVNLNSVREVQLLKTGKRTLLLEDGTRVPLARGLNQLRDRL